MPLCFFRALIGTLLIATAAGAEEHASSPLARMLRSLPDTSQQGVYQRYFYFDLRAIEGAHEVQRPSPGPVPESAAESAGRWSRALGGLEKFFAGYPSRTLLALLVPETNEGPERQKAVRLALAIDEVMILAGEGSVAAQLHLGAGFDDPDTLNSILVARGFRGVSPPALGAAREGVQFWLAQTPGPAQAKEDPSDPLGPLLGWVGSVVKDGNRIILNGDESLNAFAGGGGSKTLASLAASRRYGALLDALAEPQAARGQVLRLSAVESHFFPDDVAFLLLGPYASTEQRQAKSKALAEGSPGQLRPYKTAVLIEQNVAGRAAVTFALVYDDRAAGTAAVEALSLRLRTYVPKLTRQPIMELVEGEPEGLLHFAEAQGQWVALVRLWQKDGVGSRSRLANYLFDELRMGALAPLTINVP